MISGVFTLGEMPVEDLHKAHLHHLTDEQRHIAYGTQFLQEAVRDAPGMADVVRRRLLDFRRRYGAIVVGLWRQGGWLPKKPTTSGKS